MSRWPRRKAALYAEQQHDAGPAAPEEVPDRGGSPAHPRPASPTCGCCATAPSCSTSRPTSRPSWTSSANCCGELLDRGPHKVVVFSQWEMMLRKAAEVVDRHGDLGYTMLHGNSPGQGTPRAAGALPRRSGVPGFPEHGRGRHRAEPAIGGHGHQPGGAVEPGRAGAAHRPGASHGPTSAGAGVQPGDARQHRGARAARSGTEALAVR